MRSARRLEVNMFDAVLIELFVKCARALHVFISANADVKHLYLFVECLRVRHHSVIGGLRFTRRASTESADGRSLAPRVT